MPPEVTSYRKQCLDEFLEQEDIWLNHWQWTLAAFIRNDTLHNKQSFPLLACEGRSHHPTAKNPIWRMEEPHPVVVYLGRNGSGHNLPLLLWTNNMCCLLKRYLLESRCNLHHSWVGQAGRQLEVENRIWISEGLHVYSTFHHLG